MLLLVPPSQQGTLPLRALPLRALLGLWSVALLTVAQQALVAQLSLHHPPLPAQLASCHTESLWPAACHLPRCLRSARSIKRMHGKVAVGTCLQPGQVLQKTAFWHDS
jgi:hypothetical protein